MNWAYYPNQELVRRLAAIRVKQAKGEATVMDDLYATQIVARLAYRRMLLEKEMRANGIW